MAAWGVDEMTADLRIERVGALITLHGRVVDNVAHQHHALQVVWSEDAAATVTGPHGTVTGGVVVIGNGVAHALHLERGVVGLVEAESVVARAIAARWLGDQSMAVVAASPTPLQDVQKGLEALAAERGVAEVDPRVEDVLAWLETLEREGRWREVSLAGALKRAHLSESRFLHVFSEVQGTPWRTYLVWRRALVAMTLAATTTDSLTDIAYRAGYADSAHLARQIKGLFGASPSSVRKNSRFVQG